METYLVISDFAGLVVMTTKSRTKVAISQDVIGYLRNSKQMNKPNVIIYRDISSMACCHGPFRMVPKVKVSDGKEPNEMFVLIEDVDGIRVWAEKALVPQIESGNSIFITVKKGLLKSLKVEIGSQVLDKT